MLGFGGDYYLSRNFALGAEVDRRQGRSVAVAVARGAGTTSSGDGKARDGLGADDRAPAGQDPRHPGRAPRALLLGLRRPEEHVATSGRGAQVVDQVVRVFDAHRQSHQRVGHLQRAHRLEQAAAESFLAFPSQALLHSKTTSPFVN